MRFEALPLPCELSEISTGDAHLVLRTVGGEHLGLGDNAFGQLAPREVPRLSSPTSLGALDRLHVSTIFSGYDHCFALGPAGEVFAWGLNCKG